MDKKNKGLVDNHDGDIILNESGTSVSFGWESGEKNTDETTQSLKDERTGENAGLSGNEDNRCETK